MTKMPGYRYVDCCQNCESSDYVDHDIEERTIWTCKKLPILQNEVEPGAICDEWKEATA